jgi:hypothetical protein
MGGDRWSFRTPKTVTDVAIRALFVRTRPTGISVCDEEQIASSTGLGHASVRVAPGAWLV